MSIADTRAAVARRAQKANQPTGQVRQQPRNLFEFVNSMSSEIARALPKHLDADRIARIALTSLRTTKNLALCTQPSFAGALMTCAQLGLEPGGATGEAYLLPFWNNRKECYEVTLVIGYQGMIKLFWQSPIAKHIDAQAVRENDFFEYEYGLNPRLVHRPAPGNRGATVAYYAVATMTTGGGGFVVLYPEDVEEIRKRSKAKDDGPWLTDYDAMSKKTCIRQLFKMLPKSPELARAVAHDESIRTDDSVDAIDIAPDFVPGELVQPAAADHTGDAPPPEDAPPPPEDDQAA